MDAPDETAEGHIATLAVGVVVRRQPGVTRWAKWAWRITGVLPGAPQAEWRVLREEGDVTEYHAGTALLTLHRTDTEGYRIALADKPPKVWAVMRPADGAWPWRLHLVTASAIEAQRHMNSDEELIEAVEMPPGLAAWVEDFVRRHHVEEPFRKRKRVPHELETGPEGKGDARVRQDADVFRAPGHRKPGGRP